MLIAQSRPHCDTLIKLSEYARYADICTLPPRWKGARRTFPRARYVGRSAGIARKPNWRGKLATPFRSIGNRGGLCARARARDAAESRSGTARNYFNPPLATVALKLPSCLPGRPSASRTSRRTARDETGNGRESYRRVILGMIDHSATRRQAARPRNRGIASPRAQIRPDHSRTPSPPFASLHLIFRPFAEES